MSKPYDKHVTYRFDAGGEEWELASLEVPRTGPPWCDVEETRKNGQEDSHMCGMLVFEDGKWDWESEPSLIVEYASQKTANAILACVRKHGHPEMERTGA